MPEGVVDLGQHVQLDQQDRRPAAVGQPVLGGDDQPDPVAQAGDRVVVGLVAQRLEQAQVVQGGGDVAAERFQDPQVVVPEPVPAAEPVAQLEVPAVAVAGSQGHHQHVPGLPLGQRGEHLGVHGPVGGHPHPARGPRLGQQRIAVAQHRFGAYPVGTDGQRGQLTGALVQPQHGHLGVELVAHLLQHRPPALDGRADRRNLADEAVHPVRSACWRRKTKYVRYSTASTAASATQSHGPNGPAIQTV